MSWRETVVYTGWPTKSKPLPNYQKIVLKPDNEIRFLRQIKVLLKHHKIIVGIKYSMCNLLCGVSNYAKPTNQRNASHKVNDIK